MAELTIRFKNRKTLELLADFARHIGLEVFWADKSTVAAKKDFLIPGDRKESIPELEEIFTGLQPNASKLRKDLWKR